MSSLDLYLSNERWSANGTFPTSILDNFPGDTVARFMLRESEECQAASLAATLSEARGAGMRTPG